MKAIIDTKNDPMMPSYDDATTALLGPRLIPEPGSLREVWRQALGFVSTSRLTRRVTVWRARSFQRRCWAQLDSHILRDIGLSQTDVEMEIGKPFWRA